MTNPSEITKVLSLLFRPGEHTCYSGSNAKGIRVFPVDKPPVWVKFFSINPLDPQHDRFPTKPHHDPNIPRRADDNCIAFRNFLIEIDQPGISITEQYNHIENLKIPWATCVYSGGKSLHFIIALEESLATREEYDFLIDWIYAIVGISDTSTRNPSRLSRFPGVLREDKGKMQDVVGIRKRVSLEDLIGWLELFPELKPEVHAPAPAVALEPGQVGKMSRKTREFLMYGAMEGERNKRLFLAAKDMAEQGWPLEECIARLVPVMEETHDYNSGQVIETIESAYRRPPKYPPRV